MDVDHNRYIKKTKVTLVFFCFIMILCCKKQELISNVFVNYTEDKAVSVSFISNITASDISCHLEAEKTAIIGEIVSEGNTYVFTPIIPFSNGKTYTVNYKREPITNFKIKPKSSLDKPELLAIYPSVDTVPENLLKMYFEFSQPMQEVGNALDYITIFDKIENHEVDAFLVLENELWNKEYTILTLWLDPGRIKKGLIPNKEKGLPLVKGHEYDIIVSQNFRDHNGLSLKETFKKEIVVKTSDTIKPEIEQWRIEIPKHKKDYLTIHFSEPLDAQLIKDVFFVTKNNSIISGNFILGHNEKHVQFMSDKDWGKGNYTISVESRIEDIAGNNLNRLFDEDLTIKKALDTTKTKNIHFKIL